MSVEFENWKKNHPRIVNNYFTYPNGKNCRWGRVRCKWLKKGCNGQGIPHVINSCIDMKTGEIYFDDNKRTIYGKFCLLSVGRPLHGIVKTLYHASLFGVAHEIFKPIKGQQSKNKRLKNVVKSLVDIVRTPIYTIALTILSIAAVIIGPLRPTLLYDLRALAGKIEKSLVRGERYNGFILAPCFQVRVNIMDVGIKYYNTDRSDDTIYSSEDKTVRGLSNLARHS